MPGLALLGTVTPNFATQIRCACVSSAKPHCCMAINFHKDGCGLHLFRIQSLSTCETTRFQSPYALEYFGAGQQLKHALCRFPSFPCTARNVQAPKEDNEDEARSHNDWIWFSMSLKISEV